MKVKDLLRQLSEPIVAPTVLGRCIPPTSLDMKVANLETVYTDAREILGDMAECAPYTSLTIALIVKNEEPNIERCLTSALRLSPDVLVVDTGSTDRTLEIVERVGAGSIQVVHRGWEEDFSATRNAALAYASGDWVFFLDADETVTSSVGDLHVTLRFWDLVARQIPLTLSPEFHESTGAVNTGSKRIMRSDGALQFHGKIHERPYRPDLTAAGDVRIPLVVEHWGYEPSEMARKSKRVRNSAIIDRCIEEEPDNPRWHYVKVRDELSMDGLDRVGAGHSLDQLMSSLGLYESNRNDYRCEYEVDAHILLCELCIKAERVGDMTQSIRFLEERGLVVEASYFQNLKTVHDVERYAAVASRRAFEMRNSVLPDSNAFYGALLDLVSCLALSVGDSETATRAVAVAREFGAGGRFDSFRATLSKSVQATIPQPE